MLIGAPVWLGNRPFRQTLSSLRHAGCDYLEFSLDFPLPECMRTSDDFRQMLDEFDLKIAFHSPLDVQTVHPRSEIFEAGMKILKRCFEFCSRFPSALYYNLHLHPRITTMKLKDIREKIKKICTKQCEEIARIGEEFGLTLTVENDFMPFEMSELIFEAVSKTGMWFTLDIGHAIISDMHFRKQNASSGGGVRRGHEERNGRDANVFANVFGAPRASEIISRWMERCADRVLVVHIHDCAFHGCEKTDHISLGRGDLDIEEVLNTVRRADFKYMLVEAFWRNRQKEEMTYDEMRRNIELCRSLL